MAVPRTSTAAHVEPGERGAAGQGPPRRRSRDSESSPAPVALREGKELINRMPQPRGWATSLEVAAGIANSLIDSYPFRPPPTHSESVEQKSTAGVAGNTPFPPLAEILTAQPCEGVAGKVLRFPTTRRRGVGNGQRKCWSCKHCANEIVANTLKPHSRGRRYCGPRRVPGRSWAQPA